MDNNPEQLVETQASLSRKRLKQSERWKKIKKKKERYSPKAPPNIKIPCKHYSSSYKCTSLKKNDILNFHAAFYKTTSKIEQDNFILAHTNVRPIARRRPKSGTRKGRTTHTIYYARRNNVLVPVCRNTFLQLLGIKKNRVNGVTTRHFQNQGQSAQENRGGDHKKKKYAALRASIIKFIKQFKPLESHYCRDSTKQRQYLPSNLNVNKLFKMYKKEHGTQFETMKGSYFRRIFNTCFNIGFGAPQTDVCSVCLQLKEQIKHEKNEEKKIGLIINKRVHGLRAQAFYKLLKEDKENLLILSFDCQKNQPMPKIPDQITYYSRQLYIYNFTIVVGHSKVELKKENVYTYTWTEDLLPKASNEIASALFHCLCTIVEKMPNVSKIRLMADGCSGQNKNSTVLGMACKYLKDYAPDRIKSLELVFPIVGHSFLPADRVFAQIEKKIKKRESIINPDEYTNIFEEHATVLKLGTEVEVKNWKEATSNIFKTTNAMHFSIKQCKRFYLRRNKQNSNVLVRGEVTYNNTQTDFKGICKKGKSVSQINPDPVPLNVKVKDAKLSDVRNLLTTHYGKGWEDISDLQYFKDVLIRPVETLQDQDEEGEGCEFREELPNFSV